MNIAPTTSPVAAAQSFATPTSPPTDPATSDATHDVAISADFQTFLQMLTVQMQNQDPLNPIDSSDYAVQLATFSAVEQQVVTNDLLSALGQQFGVMQVSQLSGWVGMEARSAAPAYFDGASVSLGLHPDPLAETSQLVVRDINGTLIEKRPIDSGVISYEWDGLDDSGSPRVSGLYQFEVENFAAGELLSTSLVESYSRVVEARNHNGEVVVVVGGNWQIPATGVTALRQSNHSSSA